MIIYMYTQTTHQVGHSFQASKFVSTSVGDYTVGHKKTHQKCFYHNFRKTKPGVKVNVAYYRDVLLKQQMLPAIRRMSGDFIFQQDSAPAHRARDTIQLLRRETPDFIGPDLWPANSPDLNPVDYRIWGLIQERVYQTAIQDIDDLKQRLTCVWAELKQSVVDKAIEQWRPRLRACVRAKGQHFEQLLN